jgi:hypothetical protein
MNLVHSPKHWIQLHIYHMQGVIFSKITHLIIQFEGSSLPDIFISKGLQIPFKKHPLNLKFHSIFKITSNEKVVSHVIIM